MYANRRERSARNTGYGMGTVVLTGLALACGPDSTLQPSAPDTPTDLSAPPSVAPPGDDARASGSAGADAVAELPRGRGFAAGEFSGRGSISAGPEGVGHGRLDGTAARDASGGRGVLSPSACAEVGERGACAEASLRWCTEGRLYTVACDAQTETGQCGWDEEGGHYACVDRADPCRGERAVGRCEGSDLVLCDQQRVQRIACKDQGGQCGFDAAAARFDCLPWSDPCAGESAAGRCDGDVLVFCAAGRVRRIDCQDTQRRCERNDAYAACGVDPASCRGETPTGRCDGTWLLWCDDEGFGSYDCATLGRVCGEDAGRPACVAP